MQANDFQKATSRTAVYPRKTVEEAVNYVILGLGNEAGECQGKWKKCIRDNGGVLTEEIKEQILSEGQDVLWYLARLAEELGTTLEDMMQKNHDKLEDRLARNVIKGSGDNR
jgi:NTP pyrophosphatase (non-canonical NTP hydrolase)